MKLFIYRLVLITTYFAALPANTADYELFANSVALYEKKVQNDGDPLYVTIPSKVGSIVACKS